MPNALLAWEDYWYGHVHFQSYTPRLLVDSKFHYHTMPMTWPSGPRFAAQLAGPHLAPQNSGPQVAECVLYLRAIMLWLNACAATLRKFNARELHILRRMRARKLRRQLRRKLPFSASVDKYCFISELTILCKKSTAQFKNYSTQLPTFVLSKYTRLWGTIFFPVLLLQLLVNQLRSISLVIMGPQIS